MDAVKALRPLNMTSVYDVLDQLGFDLGGWAINAKGTANKNPAVNGRAYAWSYRDEATRQDVFMLWHEDMTERDGRVRYLQNWQNVVADLEAKRPITARRADRFLRHVSNLPLNAIVRVGIVEGSRATSSSDESSSVARRVLDSEVWHLSRWDPITSTYEFTRGLPETGDRDSSPLGAGDRVEANEVHSLQVASPEGIDDVGADVLAIMADNISAAEKEQLIAARLGQGRFRASVLARWGNRCAVTGSTTLAAIRASHCLPWRSGTNQERLDPANGIPLIATLDALFDAGLISFTDDGALVVSPLLADETLSLRDLRLMRQPCAAEAAYLAYHRATIFKQP